ncbi:MAG: PfkB family carbohydrate kinase [Chloroflexota bacterium]
MAIDVVTLGEILIDMFPAEVGRKLAEVTAFHPKPGGAPANVAVAVRRLGAASAFVGKVGDDAFGDHLIDVLRRQGVETRGLRVARAARTTMAFIAMPDPHTAEFVFYRNPGADLLLRAEELDRELLAETAALHIGSLSLVDEPARSATYEAVRLAREGGAMVSFDVNYRPSLWPGPEEALAQMRAMIPRVDLLKVNETELSLLVGGAEEAKTATGELLQQGPALVVLTCGRKGSYARFAAGEVSAAAFQVDTVDATGCGDAFIAALLTQLVSAPGWRGRLTTDHLSSLLRYANAVAALTAQTQGVIPALPTAAQVERFLDTYSQGKESAP